MTEIQKAIKTVQMLYGQMVLIAVLDHFEYKQEFEICEQILEHLKSEGLSDFKLTEDFMLDYRAEFWKLGLSGDTAVLGLPHYLKDAIQKYQNMKVFNKPEKDSTESKYVVGFDDYKEDGKGSVGVCIYKDGTVEYFGKEKKTSAQWYELQPEPTIMDPDGWDRSNYQYSFYEELITLEEFVSRRMFSTCIFNKNKPHQP